MSDDLIEILASPDEFLATPGAHAKLRRAVLEYAFAGNLGIGFGEGESADEILDRIASSSHESGNKLFRDDPAMPNDEVPYPLPEGWRWVHLSVVCTHIVDCLHRTPKYSEVGYPAIRTNDIRPGKLFLETARRVSKEEYLHQTQRLVPKAGDIFYSREGNYGMAAVVPDGVEICLSQRMMQFRVHKGVNPAYFSWALNSPVLFEQAKKSVTGTTVPHVNIRALKKFAFPLAPSGEQQRIVEWIDKAMDLIDRHEATCLEREDERRRLTRSAFREASRRADTFALDHLDELVQTPADVRDFDEMVRELAVRGLFATARSGDKPVAEYLAQVRSLALDSPDLVNAAGRSSEIPYELPAGWRWVVLGSLLSGIQAGWSPSAQARPKEGDEWGVLKVSACSWGEFKSEENKALLTGEKPRPDLEVQSGDFLISRANTVDLVARSVVVRETPPHLMLSDKTLRLCVVPGCNVDYLNLANLAQAARAHYENEATGTSSSMRNVSQKAIRRTPIPLPPREEQDRIMATVDELMGLLRRLRVEMAA
ncbi:restriction endonuclease subunit S [Streptomyces sp. NPDC059631]|uniref:restriction endonuclease subunit S n=1 Tax=unclassified Streptomyces TaxID=2593676 RepID=UPI003680F155